jgi:hypothetical protein
VAAAAETWLLVEIEKRWSLRPADSADTAADEPFAPDASPPSARNSPPSEVSFKRRLPPHISQARSVGSRPASASSSDPLLRVSRTGMWTIGPRRC